MRLVTDDPNTEVDFFDDVEVHELRKCFTPSPQQLLVPQVDACNKQNVHFGRAIEDRGLLLACDLSSSIMSENCCGARP